MTTTTTHAATDLSIPPPFESDLLKILLAEPALVATASKELASSQIEHAGVRKIVEGLYRLHAEGLPADLDRLRGQLDDALVNRAIYYRQMGLYLANRPGRLLQANPALDATKREPPFERKDVP